MYHILVFVFLLFVCIIVEMYLQRFLCGTPEDLPILKYISKNKSTFYLKKCCIYSTILTSVYFMYILLLFKISINEHIIGLLLFWGCVYLSLVQINKYRYTLIPKSRFLNKSIIPHRFEGHVHNWSLILVGYEYSFITVAFLILTIVINKVWFFIPCLLIPSLWHTLYNISWSHPIEIRWLFLRKDNDAERAITYTGIIIGILFWVCLLVNYLYPVSRSHVI